MFLPFFAPASRRPPGPAKAAPAREKSREKRKKTLDFPPARIILVAEPAGWPPGDYLLLRRSEQHGKLRIGIIGTGGISNSHVKAYQQMEDVEIVAGADIVPGKAREALDRWNLPQAKAFENTQEMLDTMELDAVSVCTYLSSSSAQAFFGTTRLASGFLHTKTTSPQAGGFPFPYVSYRLAYRPSKAGAAAFIFSISARDSSMVAPLPER